MKSFRTGLARRCFAIAAVALPLIGAVAVARLASAEGDSSLTPQIRVIMNTGATVHKVLVKGQNEAKSVEFTSLDYRGGDTWERAYWHWSWCVDEYTGGVVLW